MTKWYLLLAVPAFLIVAALLWDRWRGRRILCVPLPPPFKERETQEAAWRQACRDDALTKADALLEMLCEAFSFNPDDRFQFAPTDRIVEIYRARYPRWQFWRIADSMEIETLMVSLDRRFGVDDATFPEATLIEIVRMMKSSAPTK